MKKISIISPCYNEEENITYCCNSIKELFNNKLNDYDYEHIICDNNSNDNSLKILKKIASTDNKIKILVNAKNYGSVKSIFNGLKNSSGDAVLMFFPADMQDPIELLPEFINKWEEGYDFVAGCRKEREEFILMRSVRKLFYKILMYVSSASIPFGISDFQLVDKKILKQIIELDDNYPFLRNLAFEFSDNYHLINYKWKKRISGTSKESLVDYIDSALNGITSIGTRPFRIILFFGFLTSMISILYGLISIFYNYFFNHDLQKGIPSILIFILFFSGLQLLILGFIGEYISSINSKYKKIKVLVKEKINF